MNKRRLLVTVVGTCILLAALASSVVWTSFGQHKSVHAAGTILGYYDGGEGTAGWACDPANPDQTLRIEEYIGDRGQGEDLIGSADAAEYSLLAAFSFIY